ncbi:hypothetical protein M0804_004936 [Polistes exclamans]|nr:hypothetical protein M0804_004936 [Polistes exclamans]
MEESAYLGSGKTRRESEFALREVSKRQDEQGRVPSRVILSKDISKRSSHIHKRQLPYVDVQFISVNELTTWSPQLIHVETLSMSSL